MKGDKMAKRSSFGNMVRRLSNITNSLLNLKSHATVKKLPSDSASGKDFIDQLGKRWIIETCSRQKVLFFNFLLSVCYLELYIWYAGRLKKLDSMNRIIYKILAYGLFNEN
ncbi:SHUGOSHIN 2-like [Olea europaea subsp. europaea]|uniref:SHUGOSHIN 2-like n=1 Tax=Olea europaea subsp. europaea TaxID=158383 RepID=A0A8S0QVA6_OLEEU|nr:SHUGOSHIN 2-like [Olea europaea subsp. europaea]